MIRNYIVSTLRNFSRNASYTIINVLGLSIGITACVVIYLIITYEVSFDRFHSKYDRIYRVVREDNSASGLDYDSSVPYPLIDAVRNDIADVPLATGIHHDEDVMIKFGDEKLHLDDIIFADSLFFDVFDFQVISGNPHVELGEPGKVFLTKSLADQIMKGKDKLTIRLGNKLDLEVVGVVADPPATSHINFSMIVSYPSMSTEILNGLPMDQWGMVISAYTYFVLPENMPISNVDERIAGFTKKYRPEDEGKTRYLTQPLSDIHFSKTYNESAGPTTSVDISSLITIGVVGLFILAIACVNFVNLATALAIRKSKEIGIRKTLGAKRSSLAVYFLFETFAIILISILISLGATEWLLKWLNGFLEKSIAMDLVGNIQLPLFLLALAVVATFLSGFYPAVILSGFNPVAVLKSKMVGKGTSGAGVRRVLVVFQFTIAQIIIIGTLIVADQMNYFKQKSLGFDKDAIINVSLPENNKERMESFKTRLLGVAGVQSVSLSLGGPTSDNNFGTNSFLTESGKDTEFSVVVKPVDFDYKDVYGLSIKAGRWFTETEMKASLSFESKNGDFVYVVNEAYARKLGFAEPSELIGKSITTGVNNINAEVIGVVGDFHVKSLHSEIEPTVMLSFPYFFYDAGIKVEGNSYAAILAEAKKAYEDIYPDFQFEYEFLDQHLDNLYRQDDRTFTLFKIFSAVSIFIGCLGLYGLISFLANQKMKEVGIRKVLGASVVSIVMLFGKEFIKLIVIAFVLAAPTTFYFMKEWLDGFAYRTDIKWTDFVMGIGATILIALVTVSYRSIRSALANPVDVLRTE